MPDRRPNLLWYCSDQQRFDTIGALGNPHVHTPNLDRLAARDVAQLADLPVPAGTHGRSLLPILTGQARPGRQPRPSRRWHAAAGERLGS